MVFGDVVRSFLVSFYPVSSILIYFFMFILKLLTHYQIHLTHFLFRTHCVPSVFVLYIDGEGEG